MATYYVWSGATGTNAGTSWTNAYTAFGSAVTAATAAGDVILVHYTHQENLSATTSYSFGNNVRVISVNKDASDAPTEMGTNGWIGSSSTAQQITITGTQRRLYLYGLTLRSGGSANANLILTASNSHIEYEGVYFQLESSGTATIFISLSSATSNGYFKFTKCKFKYGNAGNVIQPRAGLIEFNNCSFDSNTTIPTYLFISAVNGQNINCFGCDWSKCTSTLVGDDIGPRVYTFAQCKLGANVTILASTLYPHKGTNAVYLFDCSSGDTHTFFGYYDAFGSCVSDTGIYYTTGAAAQSWKITTTANCSYYTPFTSPFVDFYNTGTSSITPYFEILRDGSTTAFQNDEVWGEFFIKSTSGSTQSTPYNDRMALLGTPANQAAGAGTGSWTGEAASAWSGKIDSGSAVTPAENGHIRGRVVVGEPSITVYVDPQIRT